MTPRPSRRWPVFLVGTVAALIFVTSAGAVPVSGTLEAPRERAAEPATGGPASHYWEEWNGFLDPGPRRFEVRRELAVVLLGETSGARPPSSFEVQGGNLMPATIVMQAGTTLRIANTDGCAHELYADGLFDPLQTAPGNARTQPVGEPGDWSVRDRLYAHVQGHIHAVPNLVARATLQATGRFSFEDVEPGTYTLTVFHRERTVTSREVEITDGRGVTLDPVSLNLAASQ